MVGFTSTSLRPYALEQVADIAASSCAQIIEWGSDCHVKSLSDAEKAKELCDDRGIIINSYGTYYRVGSGESDEWKNICEITACMGAKYIRTWLGTKASAKTSESEYAALIEDARKTAFVAAEHGLTVCNECHPNTYNDTTESSLRLMKDAGQDNIKTYYQSWYLDEPSDKEKLIKTFPLVQDVHLSFSELEKFQRFHKKDKDYIIKILSWLKELGFDGGLMIEFTKGSKAENLIKDVERLAELWKNA